MAQPSRTADIGENDPNPCRETRVRVRNVRLLSLGSLSDRRDGGGLGPMLRYHTSAEHFRKSTRASLIRT
jgi:hypothetical protein